MGNLKHSQSLPCGKVPLGSKSAPTARDLPRSHLRPSMEAQAGLDKSATASSHTVLSARDLRALARSEYGAQANSRTAAPSTAVPVQASPNSQEGISFDSRSNAPTALRGGRKSHLSSQQEQHHSGPLSQSPSLGGDLRQRNSIHTARDSNLTHVQRTDPQKIDFPSPNNPVWKTIDEELSIAIRKVFNSSKMKAKGPSIALKFGDWLHKFFKDKFGVVEPKQQHTSVKREPRCHRGLEQLRQQKQQLKKARKALLKAGLQGSAEEQMLNKRWRSLLRRHNGLRRVLRQRAEQRAQRSAEKSFRRDPQKFAS